MTPGMIYTKLRVVVGFTVNGSTRYAGCAPVGGAYMKIRFASLLAAGMLVAGAVTTTTSAFGQTMPKVGDMAPDFSMKYFTGNDLKDVKLSDFRGKKNVVLAFYVFAFTGG